MVLRQDGGVRVSGACIIKGWALDVTAAIGEVVKSWAVAAVSICAIFSSDNYIIRLGTKSHILSRELQTFGTRKIIQRNEHQLVILTITHTQPSSNRLHHNSTNTLTSLLHPASNSISSHAVSRSTSNTGACSAIVTVCIGTTFCESMTKTSSLTDLSRRVET